MAFKILQAPEYSEWVLYLNPHVTYHIRKGTEPRWFHRKMQELCFGIKWRKYNPQKHGE